MDPKNQKSAKLLACKNRDNRKFGANFSGGHRIGSLGARDLFLGAKAPLEPAYERKYVTQKFHMWQGVYGKCKRHASRVRGIQGISGDM